MSAAGFAIGAAWLGYSQTAWIGVAMVLVGSGCLVLLERRTGVVTRNPPPRETTA